MGPGLAGLTLGRERRIIPPGAVASLLALAVVASTWVIAVEPAYTAERPERRRLRYVQDMLQQKALWEAGTHERTQAPVGTDPAAPRDWQADDQAAGGVDAAVAGVRSLPVPRARDRTGGAAARHPQHGGRRRKAGPTCWLEATAVPRLEGTGVAFVLPWGVQPADPSLQGVVRDGRWRATVMPAPPAGITLRVRLSAEECRAAGRRAHRRHRARRAGRRRLAAPAAVAPAGRGRMVGGIVVHPALAERRRRMRRPR